MPLSIASAASGGGASAAAVASSSEPSISSVRARYGRSSSTSPRSLRPRAPVWRIRRRSSARWRWGCSETGDTLDRVAVEEHLVRQALGGDLGVQLGLAEQLVVRAAGHQLAVLEHDDLV